MNRTLSFCGLALVVLCGLGSAPGVVESQRSKPPRVLGEWSLDSKNLKKRTLRARKGIPGRVYGKPMVLTDPLGESTFFNGANDYVVLADPHTKGRRILPSRDMTLEAWVSINSPRRWGGILSCLQDDGNSEQGWILGYDEKRFYFGLATQGANDGDGKITYLKSKTEYTRGRWHHVVATYDGKSMKLYVDGEAAAESGAQSGPVLYPRATTYALGAFYDSNERYLHHGRIRQAAVYRSPAAPEWVRTRFDEHAALTKLAPNFGPDQPETATGKALTQEQAIDRAIDRGTTFLLKQIDKNRVADKAVERASGIAFETYALTVAGVPLDHPLLAANFDDLRSSIYGRKNTYGVSCYILALDAAIAQIEFEHALLAPFTDKSGKTYQRAAATYRDDLHKAVAILLDSQQDGGGYRYYPSDKTPDNSCTQFAALAMGVGSKRNMNVPFDAWDRLGRYFLKEQQKDGKKTEKRVVMQGQWVEGDEKAEDDHGDDEPKKQTPKQGDTGVAKNPKEYPAPLVGSEEIDVLQRGWGYTAAGRSWNMTCAGVSSQLLVRANVKKRWPAEDQEALRKSIWDGYGVLLESWSPTSSYYGMYSLEKVADLGEVRLFDTHDWYQECVDHLLARQLGDGSWPNGSGHHEVPRFATSYALLILKRATSLMTRDPSSVVIFTGSGGREKSQQDRNWVFIPELDTSVHAPQVLRTVRARPRGKWIELLASMCANYREEFRYELIPGLLEIRSKAGPKVANRLATQCLAAVVGAKLGGDVEYLKWHDQAQEIVTAWDDHNFSAIPALMEIYAATPHLALKRLAGRAFTRLGATEAIAVIAVDLESDQLDDREFAYRAIEGLSANSIPKFDAAAEAKVRAEQLAALKEWLAKQDQ